MTLRIKTPVFTLRARLGAYQPLVEAALAQLRSRQIIRRIWDHDPTVWRPDPTEISNRLGWLHLPGGMMAAVDGLRAFADEVAADGFDRVLLLGMGGSSLAPEVFARTFGPHTSGRGLHVEVLDSTHPDAVLAKAARFDPARTLYIVSTKSGGTVETFSFFRYFYNRTAEQVGLEAVGRHFVAITDPGSGLADTARRYGFRRTFLNDPTIGGRYSALSYFGLAPAALVGVDVGRLLERAQTAAAACARTDDNPAALLGVVMAELAKQGRDKLTFVLSPTLPGFDDWVEQLIAESTGKEGKGILPVVGEGLRSPRYYGADRVFVQIRLAGESEHDAALARLAQAGHPVLRLELRDPYDLGGQFFLWEMATAVAGHLLDIQPFDQPNVESAKVLARQMVAAYRETGRLPSSQPLLVGRHARVFGQVPDEGRRFRRESTLLRAFLDQAQPGDYVAIQAYIAPTPAADAALALLRQRIQARTRLATTVGYGPRFLHSTGQLHKGDAGRGLFLQLTDTPQHDAPIPDEAGATTSTISFGVLVLAQALGDGEALRAANRRLLRFHFEGDTVAGIQALAAALA